MLTFFSLTSKAQYYDTGIGVRLGASNGLTVKHFISKYTALEGIVTWRWQGVNVTGLYEIQKPIPSFSGLSWYYGGGAHLGFWDGNNNHPWFEQENDSNVVFGIDGTLGLEYVFVEAPLSLSLDWKPGINLIGYQGFWADEVGLSIRVAF